MPRLSLVLRGTKPRMGLLPAMDTRRCHGMDFFCGKIGFEFEIERNYRCMDRPTRGRITSGVGAWYCRVMLILFVASWRSGSCQGHIRLCLPTRFCSLLQKKTYIASIACLGCLDRTYDGPAAHFGSPLAPATSVVSRSSPAHCPVSHSCHSLPSSSLFTFIQRIPSII